MDLLPKGINIVILFIIVWEVVRILGTAQIFYWSEVDNSIGLVCPAHFV